MVIYNGAKNPVTTVLDGIVVGSQPHFSVGGGVLGPQELKLAKNIVTPTTNVPTARAMAMVELPVLEVAASAGMDQPL